MRPALVMILAVASLSAAPAKERFTGIITDDMCALAGHASMRMGPTDAACTVACVMLHDALYVLYDGKTVYTLSDQRTPKRFAGQKVTVTGTVDSSKRIRVDSITAAR
jgi:hypothetical protein